MKRIPEKADALNNKMRPGNIFISKRTDNFKYIDTDGSECWITPMSRYYAATEILRGQPVSIAQISDLDESLAKDEYPYVKITDPDKDESCIGIATNYAEAGQIVQIQRTGKFNYLTTKSKKYTKEKEIGKLKEVYIDEESGFLFDNVRGQTIYIKSVTNSHDNNHDSEETSYDSNNNLTYNFIDSVYSTKNTIQLGHLTDAPTLKEDNENYDKDQVVTIELEVTGDTRGPIDNTQYLLTLGEDIDFSIDKETLPTDPYNNEGIFNEVKAISIATHGPTKAVFGITYKTPETNIGKDTSFISVRKLGGKSIIIPFTEQKSFEDLCNKLTGANDIGYTKLLKSKYHSDQETPIILSPVTNIEEIPEKIIEALQQIDEDIFKGATKTKASDETADITEYLITASKEGGYFDIYESEDLVKYINVKTRCHGSSAKAGTAILADIRDENRCNVVGICISNQEGVHKKGEIIKVMKLGKFVTQGHLATGKTYYLGLEGRIITKSSYWYDTNVKIGIAEDSKNLIVGIEELQHDFNGSLPIGSLRPCTGGEAEKGYLLCDGVTNYSIELYPELYECLQQWYSTEEIKGTEENSFIIPKITMNDGITFAQMKYTISGIYRTIPRAPFLRKSGNISETGSIEDYDITSLVHYGNLEQSRVAPTLENIDVRLFVRDPNTKLVEDSEGNFADPYVWREIPQGFHLYNNDTLFGFDWVVLQDDYVNTDGLYVLHMNIENGLGVCRYGKHGQPISLKNVEYKLIVTAKNLWTREYSLVENSDVAKTMNLSTDELAPSVNAIKDYYKNEVVTNSLDVADSTFKFDKDTARINTILSVKDLQIDDKEFLYKEDLESHINETADTDIGVHGIINKGYSGNINAKTLDGLLLGDGAQALAKNLNSSEAYIPYVKIDTTKGYETIFNTGVEIGRYKSDNTLVSRNDVGILRDSTNTDYYLDKTIVEKNVSKYVKSYNFATKELFETYKSSEGNIEINYTTDDLNTINLTGLDTIKTNTSIQIGNSTLDSTTLQNLTNSSSIAYKNVIGEYIDPYIKSEVGTTLTPNDTKDVDGNLVEDLDTTDLSTEFEKDDDLETISKFGEALQALYELPLATFKYKKGSDDYKEQLGILVERVNQIRDNITEKKEVFKHKRNTLVSSNNANITNASEGLDKDNNSQRSQFNDYEYTETEVKQISNYLNLVTNKKELAQELRSTVSILLKAAKETQERLLNVETSVFGFDSPTLPGDDEKRKVELESLITDETLRSKINNSPLLLGLNRLIRAICLELYDTTDLEKIDAETTSVLTDSDNLKDKVTVASRLDKVDKLVSDNLTKYNGLVQFYENSLKNSELIHTYENLVVDNVEVKSSESSIEEVSDILDNNTDDHNRTSTQVDKSGTWKTLPSPDDLSEDIKVGYGKIFEGSEKHRPNESEVGIVRTPEFEDKTIEITSEDGSKKVPVTIRSIKYDYDTGKPYFNSWGVAWLDSKVQRMNLKLSEITKTIYGVDDVSTSLPNRTETLRRNITNLVDDLYPNRSFEIEKVLDNGLVNPFEQSTDIVTGNKDVLGNSTNPKTDEIQTNQHTSIIKHFVDDLYSYKISQDWLPNLNTHNLTTSLDLTQEITVSEQITSANNTEIITLNANKLSTEIDSEKSFEKAYSQIDLILDLIGEKDVWVNKLVESNNWNTFEANLSIFENKLNNDTNNFTTKFKNELTYNKVTSVVNGKLQITKQEANPKLSDTTTLGTVLSRKEKTIANRLTTIEASLDNLATFTGKLEKYLNDKDITYNELARFEDVDFETNLSCLKDTKTWDNTTLFFTFNKDILTRSFTDNLDVNKKILNKLKDSYEFISKSVYEPTTKQYTLTFKRLVNSATEDIFGIKDINSTLVITVKYVEKLPNETDYKVIYLKYEDVSSDSTEIISQIVSDKPTNIKGLVTTDNLSSYNETQVLSKIVRQMYQNMFDMSHPVGSYYWSDKIADGKPVFDIPDYLQNINTGTWERIKGTYLYAADDNNINDIGKLNPGKNTFTITKDNLPKLAVRGSVSVNSIAKELVNQSSISNEVTFVEGSIITNTSINSIPITYTDSVYNGKESFNVLVKDSNIQSDSIQIHVTDRLTNDISTNFTIFINESTLNIREIRPTKETIGKLSISRVPSNVIKTIKIFNSDEKELATGTFKGNDWDFEIDKDFIEEITVKDSYERGSYTPTITSTINNMTTSVKSTLNFNDTPEETVNIKDSSDYGKDDPEPISIDVPHISTYCWRRIK